MASNAAELAQTAEEFVGEINAPDDAEMSAPTSDSKLTLEERKKKMDELRGKMVRYTPFH